MMIQMKKMTDLECSKHKEELMPTDNDDDDDDDDQYNNALGIAMMETDSMHTITTSSSIPSTTANDADDQATITTTSSHENKRKSTTRTRDALLSSSTTSSTVLSNPKHFHIQGHMRNSHMDRHDHGNDNSTRHIPSNDKNCTTDHTIAKLAGTRHGQHDNIMRRSHRGDGRAQRFFLKNPMIQTAAVLSCVTLMLLGFVAFVTHSLLHVAEDSYSSRSYNSASSSSSSGGGVSSFSTTPTTTRAMESDHGTRFTVSSFDSVVAAAADQEDSVFDRSLQDNNNDNNNGNNGNDNANNSYEDYTCDDIFQYTQPNTAERCLFAQTCNSSQGLFASFVFCNTLSLSTTTWCLLLSPFLILWLVLLFLMLGSTAEDFFSPSLEMFSVKMGLPPRFAGVTLLALGNGAADVSATMSAIELNPAKGYQMSLGALTGAGMFVGTVVAGIVMVLADGVKCRGALVRDLAMFVITCTVVHQVFQSGKIGQTQVEIFLGLYVGFVMVVLAADVYHRKVVLPRLRQEQQAGHQPPQVQFQLPNPESREEGREGDERLVSPTAGIELASSRTSSTIATEAFHTPLNSELEEMMMEDSLSNPAPAAAAGATASDANPVRPKRNILQRGLDRIMVAMSNYGPNEGRSTSEENENVMSGWGGSGLEVHRDKDDEYVKLHGTHGLLARHGGGGSREESETQQQEEGRGQPGQNWFEYGPATSYRALMDGVDQMCTIPGAGGGTPASWNQAMITGMEELRDHFRDYYNDIWDNDENSPLDKFLLTCELPFTSMRKLSVPIPCEDYYCRGLLAISVFFTPLWIGLYAALEHDTNLFVFGGFPYVEISTLVSTIIALLILKFAPADISDLSLKVSVPLAFLGFIVAATWIDVIADQLVQLLTFLGVICRIPGSIMGLTVLAWGNSMGDLSANMTMAKKGLANMAITACFAGPVFNILVGLGGGFWKLNASTGQEWAEVELTPSIRVGLMFLVANCVMVLISGLLVNRGHIPKGYGYVALALYVGYVCTSIGLQYHHN